MSARLTVVLDDETLYRDLKVRAAEQGLPLKAIVQAALQAYLAKEAAVDEMPEIQWDWDTYDAAEREIKERWSALPLADHECTPSDVKHQLYGERLALVLAREYLANLLATRT